VIYDDERSHSHDNYLFWKSIMEDLSYWKELHVPMYVNVKLVEKTNKEQVVVIQKYVRIHIQNILLVTKI